jgi:hypothetical protein
MEIASKIDLPALCVNVRPVVVAWVSEAGSGEASMHHSWCIEMRVNSEPWRYAVDHEPGDRADRWVCPITEARVRRWGSAGIEGLWTGGIADLRASDAWWTTGAPRT